MRWLFRTPVFGDPDVCVVQLRHTCSEECYSHDQWEVADTSMEKAAFAGLDSEPPALVLTTPGAVWSCSLCVRWNGRADQVEAHLSDK